MFRNVLRKKNAVGEDECIKLLNEQTRGVLAVLGDDGYPYALPINFLYDEGMIYFHCGPVGHKLDAIERCPKVSFCVYDQGYLEEGDRAFKVTSTRVFGRAEEVTDIALKEEICRKLSAKFPVSKEETDAEVARSLPATRVIRIVPEHMTGKRIREA